MIFFIFLKLFLILAYQNNLKTINLKQKNKNNFFKKTLLKIILDFFSIMKKLSILITNSTN
jgi:hypothetical protein